MGRGVKSELTALTLRQNYEARNVKGTMALKSVESQNIEFKSNQRDEYLPVIFAFANADGGRLIIGVDDKGKAIGVENE